MWQQLRFRFIYMQQKKQVYINNFIQFIIHNFKNLFKISATDKQITIARKNI